jgi:hypothetical protein
MHLGGFIADFEDVLQAVAHRMRVIARRERFDLFCSAAKCVTGLCERSPRDLQAAFQKLDTGTLLTPPGTYTTAFQTVVQALAALTQGVHIEDCNPATVLIKVAVKELTKPGRAHKLRKWTNMACIVAVSACKWTGALDDHFESLPRCCVK